MLKLACLYTFLALIAAGFGALTVAAALAVAALCVMLLRPRVRRYKAMNMRNQAF